MERFSVVLMNENEETVGEYWGFVTMETAMLVAEILSDTTIETVAYIDIESYTITHEEWLDMMADEEER